MPIALLADVMEDVVSEPDPFAPFTELESNVRSYCRVWPAVFRKAKNAELFDEAGRRYIDFFCGAGGLNYGHNPERIKQRVLEYLRSDGVIHGLDAYTSAKREFLAEFQRVILGPRGLGYKVQCCGPTGTDAVEAALKLARKVTGRRTVIAFGGSYHGVSLGSLAVSSMPEIRRAAGVGLHDTVFVPYPDGPQGSFDSVGYLTRLLDDPCSGVEPPAAVVFETLQLEGGVYPAPASQLEGLRALCDRHGIVLACDDIQAGCGRTGTFFSFERARCKPDLIMLSKSISGYGFPMSMVLIRRELDRWQPGEHPGTFRGHQLSFVGATAALSYWEDPGFPGEIVRKGRLIRELLEAGLRTSLPEVGVRSLGMVCGLDLSCVGGGEVAAAVVRMAFERGVVIEACGRGHAVVKVMPPLVCDDELLREGCARLLEATIAAVRRLT